MAYDAKGITMQELMERVGDSRFNYVKALLRDALAEIQILTGDNIASFTTDIINGQSEYGTPLSMIKLKAVKVKNDDTDDVRYYPIKRTYDMNIVED
jgi:hypothetical protein